MSTETPSTSLLSGPPSRSPRLLIWILLVMVMAATRIHHFAAVPDASWAVFFIGGFYLRHWSWATFPALMALAVGVDALVITRQGLDFWDHYCVSPGYWMLLPAYCSLWLGGGWLQYRIKGHLRWSGLWPLAGSVAVSVALCHVFAQGGFYWTSVMVVEPTLAGWWKNWSDWYFPYLRVVSAYVGVAVLIHLAIVKISGTTPSLRKAEP